MHLWTEKYMPTSFLGVQGHDTTLEKLKCFVLQYKKGALLAYGPTGCGKTCSVHALAKELDYEILELNASDLRNKEKMISIVGSSAGQMSLFHKGKIILVDEIDALSGMRDRGCLQALAKIIQDSKWPIIMVADDPWNSKLADIRKKVTMIEFRTLSYLSVMSVLKRICEKEGITYEDDLLKSLARTAGGDLRAAVNDLQTMTILNKHLDTHEEVLGDRLQKESILNALRLVFKSKTPAHVIGAFDNINEDLREVRMWIDHNLPYEYSSQDLKKAYDMLSRADVFNGRIMRWQYWRFLVYINYFMTVGIALAKEEKSKNFVTYKRSSRILKLWQAKMKYAKKKAIAEKLAEHTHTSRYRALKDTLPYIKLIFQQGKGQDIALELELTKEEIAYLCN